jgi:hypothetical protein
MAFSKTLPLDERTKALRADVDAFIDARVSAIAKDCPGVPAASIRISVTRGNECQCAVYLEMTKDERKDAA